MEKSVLGAVLLSSLLLAACSSGTGGQTFAEAHDAFETKLVEQRSSQDEVPQPPAGIFELNYYDSKIGPMAAYVSSDPADGEKHPLIIWVVGGWGNDIDEFVWSYPDWEDDQSASAYREAGILMMYPSFRGANGNPGNDESLFGEVDDIVSAYEYAASLPYVDPERIYLGGHSTGGTKVLLAAEYTDKFRAVFSFGPVDEIKAHNKSQFTFDTGNKDEYRMRSPIYWLQDIKSPTFVIEGDGGNASCLRSIEKKSGNDNIHCYIVEGTDHFEVLAPVNRLLAEKIINDTGTEVNITLTQDELQTAMKQLPVISYPVMVPYRNADYGFSMEIPAIWEAYDDSTEEYIQYSFYSPYDADNFWESLTLYVDVYGRDGEITFDEFMEYVNYDTYDYQGEIAEIGGQSVYIASDVNELSNGRDYYIKIAAFQKGEMYLEFWFYVPEEHREHADHIITNVIESVVIE